MSEKGPDSPVAASPSAPVRESRLAGPSMELQEPSGLPHDYDPHRMCYGVFVAIIAVRGITNRDLQL